MAPKEQSWLRSTERLEICLVLVLTGGYLKAALSLTVDYDDVDLVNDDDVDRQRRCSVLVSVCGDDENGVVENGGGDEWS